MSAASNDAVPIFLAPIVMVNPTDCLSFAKDILKSTFCIALSSGASARNALRCVWTRPWLSGVTSRRGFSVPANLVTYRRLDGEHPDLAPLSAGLLLPASMRRMAARPERLYNACAPSFGGMW